MGGTVDSGNWSHKGSLRYRVGQKVGSFAFYELFDFQLSFNHKHAKRIPVL